MKEKPNSVRCYDKDGFRLRAAGLCVQDDLENQILLVTSSSIPGQWIVPGGGIEPDEEPERAAVREVLEEAGVEAELKRFIGVYENPDRKHRTSVFVLKVTEELKDYDEKTSRERRWFSVDEAVRHLAAHKPLQSTYVQSLNNIHPTPEPAQEETVVATAAPVEAAAAPPACERATSSLAASLTQPAGASPPVT